MIGPLIVLGLIAAIVLFINRAKVRAFLNIAPATAPTPPGPAPVGGTPPKKWGDRAWEAWEWFMEYLWTILLVGIGVAIFLFGGLYTPGLHQSDLGSWSWDHWLPLLGLWAVLIAIIAINGKPLGKAEKWLQWMTAAAAFMLFIGVPTGTWVASGLGITTFPRVSCPAFSPDETRSCVLTEYWSLPITVDRPTYAGEYTFCISVPEGGLREQKLVGLNTYEYRSGKGALPIQYKLFKGGCPVSF